MKYKKPLIASCLIVSLLWLLHLPHPVVHADPASPPVLPTATSIPTPLVVPTATTNTTNQDKTGLPPGYILIEGDILVPSAYVQPDAAHPNGTSISPLATQLWPNGVVPYGFDVNVTVANRNAMIAAMAEWEQGTGGAVRFRPRSANDTDYVHILAASENSSMVGRQGGRQVINIFSWNSTFTMAHELGHALGLWHEQSRPDRDSFVRIQPLNIEEGMARNFQLRTDASQYGWYDFDSVMHYNECAFSRFQACPDEPTALDGGRTIIVQPAYQSTNPKLGQRDYLSYLDKLTVAFLYPLPDWRFLDASRGFSIVGSFAAPFNQFRVAYVLTPANGTVWIQPGNYSAGGDLSQPITLRAPLGGVTLTK